MTAATATPEPFTAAAVRAEKLRRCEADVVYWLTRYGRTYDPRDLAEPDKPFVPWPKQVDYFRWLEERERLGAEGKDGNGLVDKMRDAGVTWCNSAFAAHRWRFRRGYAIGFGSRKLDLVDRRGDPDCIFEKIRYLIDHMPPWMLPGGYRKADHDNEAKIVNPENGSTITGEGGDDIGRGGRKTIYFVDEAAHLRHPRLVERSLSQTTRVRIDCSTHNGPGTVFYEKEQSGRVAVFTFDWWEDPRKNHAETRPDGKVVYPWMETQKKCLDPVTLAQEVLRDATASIPDICIPGHWVRAAVELDLPGFEDSAGWGGLDVGGEGANDSVLAARRGPVVLPLESWSRANTTQTAWKAKEHGERLGVASLCYEHAGVGHGPKGTWESAGDADRPSFATRPVNTGAPPTKKVWRDGKRSDEKFLNLRAEMWWELRQRFENAYEYANDIADHPPDEMVSIPNDAKLIAELSSVKRLWSNNGKIKVESKKDMRARGVKSPDRADAVVLSFFEGDPASKYEREELLVL